MERRFYAVVLHFGRSTHSFSAQEWYIVFYNVVSVEKPSYTELGGLNLPLLSYLASAVVVSIKCNGKSAGENHVLKKV